MVKRVDVAVYNVLKGFKAGPQALGLKEDGVMVAIDQHNDKLVTADLRGKLEAFKADIVAGKRPVADFMANPAACAKK
jgi:basic membrane protein A